MTDDDESPDPYDEVPALSADQEGHVGPEPTRGRGVAAGCLSAPLLLVGVILVLAFVPPLGIFVALGAPAVLIALCVNGATAFRRGYGAGVFIGVALTVLGFGTCLTLFPPEFG
jgi:hypothetical protein